MEGNPAGLPFSLLATPLHFPKLRPLNSRMVFHQMEDCRTSSFSSSTPPGPLHRPTIRPRSAEVNSAARFAISQPWF